MRTRIIEALSDGKDPRIVNKVVVYDDSGKQVDCCLLRTDELDRKFYYPSNPNEKYGLYNMDHIKDAIDCIRNDFGDGFATTSVLGMHFGHVVRFLDRTYGENIRQKTLEGWKDTQFAYGVKYGNMFSFSDGRIVGDNYVLISPWDENPPKPMAFDTEEEASRFIEEIETKAQELDNEYTAILNSDMSQEEKDIEYHKVFDKAQQTKDGKEDFGSVIWNVFSAVDEARQKGEKQHYIRVVQIVKK